MGTFKPRVFTTLADTILVNEGDIWLNQETNDKYVRFKGNWLPIAHLAQPKRSDSIPAIYSYDAPDPYRGHIIWINANLWPHTTEGEVIGHVWAVGGFWSPRIVNLSETKVYRSYQEYLDAKAGRRTISDAPASYGDW